MILIKQEVFAFLQSSIKLITLAIQIHPMICFVTIVMVVGTFRLCTYIDCCQLHRKKYFTFSEAKGKSDFSLFLLVKVHEFGFTEEIYCVNNK